MDDFTRRAISAYLKTDASGFPDESLSGARVIDGRKYIVLKSGPRTVAVYRVRTNGMLKRMRRPPADLTKNMGSVAARERADAAQREAVPA